MNKKNKYKEVLKDMENIENTKEGKKLLELFVIIVQIAIFALGVLLVIMNGKGFLSFPVISFILMKLFEIILLTNDRDNVERPITLASMVIIVGSMFLLVFGMICMPETSQMASLVLALALVLPSIIMVNVFNLLFMLITSIIRSVYHYKLEKNKNKNKNKNKKK